MFWHWGLFGHWLPFFGIFGFLFRIAFFVAVIVIVVAVLRRSSRGHFGTGHPRAGFREDSAAEILKSRYARGEISKEELEQKLKDIS
jgi:uncharacterized membrane protein